MSDSDINSRSSRDVARLSTLLLLVRAEQTGVVALLHDDERDAWLVVRLQLDAGFSDG